MSINFKVLLCALALLMVAPASMYAQKSNKALKKDLTSKVQKDSRKEAKKLIKAGWKTMPGKLPIDRQIQDSKYAELDVNESGDKRFFVGSHQSIGGNYSAAKQIADNRARMELAQNIYTAIAQKIETQLANNDYGSGDVELIDEFVSANKSIISAQLQGVMPVLEIYREKDKGKFEVSVMVTIDAEKALKLAKSGLYNELKQKSEKLAKDLDSILPY